MNTLESLTVYLSTERKTFDNSAVWIAYGQDLKVYMVNAASAEVWRATETAPISIPLRFNEENEIGPTLIEPVIAVDEGLIANSAWLNAQREIFYWRSDGPQTYWDSCPRQKQATA